MTDLVHVEKPRIRSGSVKPQSEHVCPEPVTIIEVTTYPGQGRFIRNNSITVDGVPMHDLEFSSDQYYARTDPILRINGAEPLYRTKIFIDGLLQFECEGLLNRRRRHAR